jgi:hypothetical protein
MAASESDSKMKFFTFGVEGLAPTLVELVSNFRKLPTKITVGEMYQKLMKFRTGIQSAQPPQLINLLLDDVTPSK